MFFGPNNCGSGSNPTSKMDDQGNIYIDHGNSVFIHRGKKDN